MPFLFLLLYPHLFKNQINQKIEHLALPFLSNGINHYLSYRNCIEFMLSADENEEQPRLRIQSQKRKRDTA